MSGSPQQAAAMVGRPPPLQRCFHSSAVEAAIVAVAKDIAE